MNAIYLRRMCKLYVKEGNGGVSPAQVATAQKEIESLGFIFSDALVLRLKTLSVESLTALLRSLIKDLRTITGAHRVHAPLYPNFPTQVLNATDAELYLNAILHYLTLRRLPQEQQARPPLLHGRSPRIIELGTLEEFEAIFTRLAGSRTSLSLQDREDLAWFIRQYQVQVLRLMPPSAPFKENLAVIGGALYRHAESEPIVDFLKTTLKTATDILRFMVAFNDGDVSLALPVKFRTMKRRQRRFVLQLLEQLGSPQEDMRRWPEQWKRLGEVIHPGEFAERYPKAFAGFEMVRNKRPIASFNGSIERFLEQGDVPNASLALTSRPGEFTRRLDHLLRSSTQPDQVLAQFAQIASRVATPVLLQALSHFQQRRNQIALRTFFPKGQLAKVYATPDHRSPLQPDLIAAVVGNCERALKACFATLPLLGPCYVDPALSQYLVPLAQRSASRSLRTLVRGSRLYLPDARFIRLFLWWKNGNGRTDIDLSAVFYGSNFDYRDTVSYYNLKGYGGYHSGDIVDAPQGAAEFIDLDLRRLREAKIRFVVASLNSYTEQAYCDLPECFAGWMAREDVNSGEVFEPRTVVDRLDVASDTRMCIPFVIDLQEACLVWTDIGLTGKVGWNNVKTNLSGISLMMRAMTTLTKPDLYTLFSLHAQARGKLVDRPEDAETIFSVENGITPFDVDFIRTDFL